MRVLEGHADFFTTVFEGENLLHTVNLGQRGGAMSPRLNNGANAGFGQILERKGGILGKTDHLTAGARRKARHHAKQVILLGVLDVGRGSKRREAVFKDHHVIARAGDLRGQLAFARGR